MHQLRRFTLDGWLLHWGVLRHPPMGALCFVPLENIKKKYAIVADLAYFSV